MGHNIHFFRGGAGGGGRWGCPPCETPENNFHIGLLGLIFRPRNVRE